MIAVDTNVLLRALADDPSAPQQCAMARKLIADAGQVRVSSIVFIETIWVLNRSYKASRREVTRIATKVLNHPLYQIEGAAQLQAALDIFSGTNVDFADAVALADARSTSCALYTFDRRLAKLDGTAVPTPS